MDRVALTVDSAEFMAALDDIVKMSSRELPEVLDGVGRDLCFAAQGKTKKAPVAKIEKLRGSKLAHALATMSGNKKGRGNKASADKIVNARKSASGYSKAIWLQIAKDLGAKLRSNVKIRHAEGIRAKQGLKPTTILEVLGLEQAHIDEVMQTGLNKAVPLITQKMIKRVESKLAQLAAKKSGKRR
jgi:predicted XRE-type DNA-binding protein